MWRIGAESTKFAFPGENPPEREDLAKYIAENQKDWDRWIPMYLLPYKSSWHETTGVTPAELYFARDLKLALDLLCGNTLNKESHLITDFIENLRK